MSRRWLLVVVILLAGGAGAWWWSRTPERGVERPVQPVAPRSERPVLPAHPRAARTGTISGRVLAPDGKPVAAARVCATLWSSLLVSDETREPRCVESGADGGYRLGDLWPGLYDLTATASGFAAGWPDDPEHPGEHSLSLEAGGSRTADIQLVAGGLEVRGKVVDVAGGPIAGALVRAEVGSMLGDRVAAFALSGQDGGFTLWLAPGEAQLHAQAAGYAPGGEGGAVPGHVFELRLTPESTLRGRVVQEGDRPVAGALVSIECDDTWETARSREDGRFSLGGLGPGRCSLSATAAGLYGAASPSLLLGLAEVSPEVVITLHPAAMVEGTLTVDGAPCQSGTVNLTERNVPHFVAADSDGKGHVVVPAVLPGTYKVHAFCEGARGRDDFHDLVVGQSDVTGQRWTLQQGLRLRGTVSDPAGKPVADALIRLESTPPTAASRWLSGQSRRDGRFEVNEVAPGDYDLVVSAPAPYASPAKRKLTVTGDSSVDVTVSVGGGVHGLVRGDDGRGVGGVTVYTAGNGPDPDWSKGSATSRDDGSYEISGLRPGTYSAWVEPEQQREITVSAGASLTADFKVKARRAELTGKVIDGDGQPVADAFIVAVAEEPGSPGQAVMESRWGILPDVLSDVDGSFVVKGVPRQPHTVRAYRKGGGEAIASGVVPGQAVTLTIPRLGSISGQVVGLDAATAPEMKLNVSSNSLGLSRDEVFFRTAGRFTFRDLPAGELTLEVRTPQGRKTTTVTLAAGEDRQLTLTLEKPTRLTGQVVDLDDGRPLGGAQVSVRSDGPSMSFETGHDGRFVIDGCPPGPVEVWVYNGNTYPHVTVHASCVAQSDSALPVIKIPRGARDDGDPEGQFDWSHEQGGGKVINVLTGGLGDRAGLHTGDLITRVNGHDATGFYAYLLEAYEDTLRPGDSLHLGLADGRELTVPTRPASP